MTAAVRFAEPVVSIGDFVTVGNNFKLALEVAETAISLAEGSGAPRALLERLRDTLKHVAALPSTAPVPVVPPAPVVLAKQTVARRARVFCGVADKRAGAESTSTPCWHCNLDLVAHKNGYCP